MRGAMHHQAPSVDMSVLNASNWSAKGIHKAFLALGNDANGYLTINATTLAERSYVELTGATMTDGTVRAMVLIEGWDTTTNTFCAGPGARMSESGASFYTSAYGAVVARQAALSGDPFNWRLVEVTANSSALIGSLSPNISGGLLTVWSDIRLMVATNGATADISCDIRREGQAAAEFQNAVIGDVTPATGGAVGIYIHRLPTTHTIRVKRFEVS